MITAKKAPHLRRILMLLLVTAGLANAAETVTLGIGAVGSNEYFTVSNPGIPARDEKRMFNAVQIKVGYGDIKAYAVEMDIGYGRYDKNIFSAEDTDYIYADIALLKAFDFGFGAYPFLKAGFGTGELEIRRSLVHSISAGDFFAGGGVYVPLAWGLDVEASVVYRDKSWEDIDMIGAQTETASYIVEPYIGLNYRF